MSDELDERLAADAAKLFSGENMEAAAANFSAARARARRKHRLVASAGSLALIAAIVAGAATLRDRGSQQLTVDSPTTTEPNAATSSFPPTETIDPRTQAPLADDVEGKMFAGTSLAVSGERLPATEESPGLAGVSLTFYQRTVTWDNGCYTLTGTYEPGAVPLEITFPDPNRAVTPAVGCANQELVTLLNDIVTVGPTRLSLVKAPDAGLQLIVSGGPGTLDFQQQPYSPSSVSCVPGVDSRVDISFASGLDKARNDVAYSDPLQATRGQLAGNNDVHQDLDLVLTLSDGAQALVTGTKDGRPVLSAVLDASNNSWNITRYVSCTPDSPTTTTPDPGAAPVTTLP